VALSALARGAVTESDPSRRAASGAVGQPSPPRHLILFFGALAALGPLSIDAYLPGIPAMAETFGVTIVSLQNTLNVFLVGYALGQFFGGSLSDQIGRKRVGYAGLSVYLVTSVAIAFTANVEQMLVLRFLQAIGGGFSTVICMATVRDIYPVEELGRRFATVTMVLLIAPLVAPALGAAVLPLGWEMIFVFKAVYAAALIGVYAWFVPETRAGALGNLSLRSVFKQCLEVVRRRVDSKHLPIRYATAMAFSAAVMMIFVTNSSFIYMQYFGVTPSGFPWLFALSVLGFMSMNLFSMWRLKGHNAGSFFRSGLTIQVVVVACLVWVVLTGRATLLTVVPLIVLTVATLGLVGPAGSTRYMGFFRELAGSASSVYTTMMFLLGGIFGWLSGALNDGTLVPVAAMMLAASLTANAISWSLPRQLAAGSHQGRS
jgi:DHA1 family bicyclomycin/chloramphenicol resistance-like MFS transporter